jgi:hypothetical protein
LRLGDARRDACRCGGASLALPGRLRVLAFVHADALSGASLRRRDGRVAARGIIAGLRPGILRSIKSSRGAAAIGSTAPRA